MALNATPPGEHLAEELTELGMSAAELARQLDVPTNRVTEILMASWPSARTSRFNICRYYGGPIACQCSTSFLAFCRNL